MQKFKLGKVSAIDDISPEILKYLDNMGKEELRILIDIIVKEKRLLKEWKTDNSALVLQEDERDCANYRGITSESVVRKVFIRIIEEWMKTEIDNTLEGLQ